MNCLTYKRILFSKKKRFAQLICDYTDIDECAINKVGCAVKAICHNTVAASLDLFMQDIPQMEKCVWVSHSLIMYHHRHRPLVVVIIMIIDIVTNDVFNVLFCVYYIFSLSSFCICLFTLLYQQKVTAWSLLTMQSMNQNQFY